MSHPKLDLNCDLGELESAAERKLLMRSITSANVACGGHAGSLKTMEMCVHWAKRHDVHVGAHPGTWDRSSMGRTPVTLTPADLQLLLVQQISCLECILRHSNLRLHHIKLHGALYHQTENDPLLRRAYLRTLKTYWPQCIVYAQANGTVWRDAKKLGLKAWGEVFLDRAYASNKQLLPRSLPNALISDPDAIATRAATFQATGNILSIDGIPLALEAQTLCLHSDSNAASNRARAAATALGLTPSPTRPT